MRSPIAPLSIQRHWEVSRGRILAEFANTLFIPEHGEGIDSARRARSRLAVKANATSKTMAKWNVVTSREPIP